MKSYEKEVLQAQLDNEKAILKKLEGNYQDALDEINDRIAMLLGRQDSDLQHVVYQVEFQKNLKTQIQSILEQLQNNEFESVSEYLTRSYEEGFIGAMYSMQKQGVPLILPLDQEQVVNAIQNETKLSESLYTSLGKDIKQLNKQIAGEISRGISNASMYSEIARNISGYARIPKNNAMRIVRTESHRIQTKAAIDACEKAKSKGADVVKQWDSSLDGRTRKSHRKLDGQIRELDEPFEVNGHKAMFPGDFGRPEEDINCRCAILQRASWNLGSDYTKWSEDAEIEYSDDGTAQLAIIEVKDYDSFRETYKQASERVREGAQKMNNKGTSQEKAQDKEPLTSHDNAGIDYRAEKVTFKDLQEWKKSIGNVTDEEYAIISGMSETGYIRSSNSYKLNKAMREGTVGELSEGNQKTISTLKEVINKNTSDRDAVLIRKVDYEYIKGVYDIDSKNVQDIVEELNKKIGTTHIEKGFVSTSYKLDKNLNMNDKIELDIYAPKGTNMYLTKNREESEIILQAGTKFELEGAVLTDDGKARLLMKVVPSDAVEEVVENTGKSSIIKLSNTEVRKRYVEEVAKIKDNIDSTLPIEEQAKQAFEARNKIRTDARNMMADQKMRDKLDKEQPNKTFEELVESKMDRKGMTREQAIQDVYDTATKTNKNINKELGLDGD